VGAVVNDQLGTNAGDVAEEDRTSSRSEGIPKESTPGESEADAGDLSIDVRESDIADGSPLAVDG
jgi:hypothetical protein